MSIPEQSGDSFDFCVLFRVYFIGKGADFNSKIDSANTIANILGGGAVERPPAAESKSVGSPNTADDMKK